MRHAKILLTILCFVVANLTFLPGVLNAHITDHHAVCLSLPIILTLVKSTDMISIIGYDRLCFILQNEEWPSVYFSNNVSDEFNNFISISQEAIEHSKSSKQKHPLVN